MTEPDGRSWMKVFYISVSALSLGKYLETLLELSLSLKFEKDKVYFHVLFTLFIQYIPTYILVTLKVSYSYRMLEFIHNLFSICLSEKNIIQLQRPWLNCSFHTLKYLANNKHITMSISLDITRTLFGWY